MVKRYEIPPISPGEATPLVKALVGVIEKLLEENQQQAEKLQHLRDEIATLKGEKAKPKLKPSNMDKEAGQKEPPTSSMRIRKSGLDQPSETRPNT